MRDLLVIGIVLLSLPLAFRRPFMGMLLFSWLAYMRPQDLCWGFARGMRFSFIVGITMVVGWFVNEAHTRPFFRPDLRAFLMILLALLMSISLALSAVVDENVTRYYLEFIKIIVVALFTIGQVDSKQRLRMLLWTIALSLGFYGFKGGLFGLLSGGAVILRGPGGMLEDNNDFALALVMNIPLLFYLGRSEKRKEIRTFCDITIMLSMITILLTHSRGGFLAMVGALLVIAWRSGRLTQAIFALLVLTLCFFAFAPQHVIDRIMSIGIEGADSSVQARFNSWTIALRMVADNPWFGVGLRNFQENFFTYGEDLIDPRARFAHVAHNSYLQIWAEGGTIAFLVYLSLLSSVFVSCWRIRRAVQQRSDMAWAFDYARMMEATTVGFMIGAMFLNRGHFDLIYHWLGLVTCLVLVVNAQLRVIPVAEGKKAAGIHLRWRSAQSGPRMLPTWGR